MSERKYILIVGASSGIGAATAKALSNSETVILLMARRKDQLESVQQSLSGESIVTPCDICDYDQISSFFAFLIDKGIKLSAMVYTAGICYVTPIKAMASGAVDKMFAINVFGFYEMCRHFQSPKISEKGSSIVALSSYASVTKEIGMSAYAMTKAAMNTAVQIMAKEFIKRCIRVNAILPANTMSIMGQTVDEWTEESIKVVGEKQPLGIIPLEEITDTIGYLLSDRAAHITGNLVEISAGYRG